MYHSNNELIFKWANDLSNINDSDNILDYEYNNYIKLHRINLNQWISTGEERYRENELRNLGAAFALLRIKEELEAKK